MIMTTFFCSKTTIHGLCNIALVNVTCDCLLDHCRQCIKRRSFNQSLSCLTLSSDPLLTRQKKWIGHTLRGESLLKTVIEGKMLGKRSRGRPRQMMLDGMMVEGYRKLKEQAQQREEWRRQAFEPA